MLLAMYRDCLCVCFNDTATTEIYTYCHTLSLPDALPISPYLFRGPTLRERYRLLKPGCRNKPGMTGRSYRSGLQLLQDQHCLFGTRLGHDLAGAVGDLRPAAARRFRLRCVLRRGHSLPNAYSFGLLPFISARSRG